MQAFAARSNLVDDDNAYFKDAAIDAMEMDSTTVQSSFDSNLRTVDDSVINDPYRTDESSESSLANTLWDSIVYPLSWDQWLREW